MPLSSSSTTAQVLAAYADNSGYEENDSLSEALAFASACRLLLSPQHSAAVSAIKGQGGGSELELDQTIYERQLNAARNFIAAKRAATSGGVTHFDSTGFRE